MKIHYLSDTWPWFGEHQCCGRLTHYVKLINSDKTTVTETRYNALNRILGKLYTSFRGEFYRKDTIFAAAEARYPSFFCKSIDAGEAYHVLFFDTHYHYFKRWAKAPKNVIATIHHPIGRVFPDGMEESLKRLSSAIVMFREGVSYFEELIGKGRVKFIPYGIDTDFFEPNPEKNYKEKHIFFTGQNGRNLDMLGRVIPRIAEKHPDVFFDMLVPEKVRMSKHLKGLNNINKVTWHDRMTEVDVREVYQKSYLLLMPMQDSGVNTAIVEALSSGLPVVTTDVGGIQDYGAGSVYPAVSNNDDTAMMDLVNKYLEMPEWHREVSRNCRSFAEKNLAWPIIAKKHLEAYKELVI